MVPEIFHFIFLIQGNQRNTFGITHYLAIKSACVVNRPKTVFFHHNSEPSGEWWEKTKPLVIMKRVDPPEEIFGRALLHPAHQADVIRLQALKEYGGVYLDMDTICIKPLQEFYRFGFAMGRQLAPPVYYGCGLWERVVKSVRLRTVAPFRKIKVHGLCNGVLLSERNSPFVTIWLDSYKSFRSRGVDQYWDEHSIKIPYRLSQKYPELITQLDPYYFHFPLWDAEGLSLLFEKNITFDNAYIHHIWESKAREKYLSPLTAATILQTDTTYNRIARRYLETSDVPPDGKAGPHS